MMMTYINAGENTRQDINLQPRLLLMNLRSLSSGVRLVSVNDDDGDEHRPKTQHRWCQPPPSRAFDDAS